MSNSFKASIVTHDDWRPIVKKGTAGQVRNWAKLHGVKVVTTTFASDVGPSIKDITILTDHVISVEIKRLS